MTEEFQIDGVFDFYKMLDKIQQRPAMYLGEKSLTKLWWFLDGYQRAMDDNDIPCKNQLWGDGRFNKWILKHYNLPSNIQGDVILEQCNGDETQALATFFELLDEFRRQEHEDIKP